MEMLPFYLGGFGILVLGLVGFGYYQNERLKKKLILLAQEQLQHHAEKAAIQQQLMGQGLEPPQADKIIELAQYRISVHQALDLLQQGKTADEAKTQLVQAGIKPAQADEAIGTAMFHKFCLDRPVVSMLLGIVMPLVGLAIMAGGLLLWLGNKSGRFVTFPFAGQLVIAVGVMILVFGFRFLVRSMSN